MLSPPPVRLFHSGHCRLKSGTLRESKMMFNGSLNVSNKLFVNDGAANLTNSSAKQMRLFPSNNFSVLSTPPVRLERSRGVKELVVPVLPPMLARSGCLSVQARISAFTSARP